MSQYYYITNSRPNENKYMKPIKPQHKPSFPCKLVSDAKAEDTKVEEIVTVETFILNPVTSITIEEVPTPIETPICVEATTEEEPKKKRRGRKKVEEVIDTAESADKEVTVTEEITE